LRRRLKVVRYVTMQSPMSTQPGIRTWVDVMSRNFRAT